MPMPPSFAPLFVYHTNNVFKADPLIVGRIRVRFCFAFASVLVRARRASPGQASVSRDLRRAGATDPWAPSGRTAARKHFRDEELTSAPPNAGQSAGAAHHPFG